MEKIIMLIVVGAIFYLAFIRPKNKNGARPNNSHNTGNKVEQVPISRPVANPVLATSATQSISKINCPACGRTLSSMAASCPGCGHPIAKSSASTNSTSGIVQIKLGVFQSTQSATIASNGRTLWSGKTGQIVNLKIDRPTKVQIKYQVGMFDGAGSCEGIIDPQVSRKWQVVSQPGFVTMKLSLQPVDVFVSN